MKYLLFNTEQESLERSAQEAISRGCGSTSTKYWWATKETKAGKWALCIDDTSNLTPAEINKLKDSVVWPNPPTP